MNKLSKIFVLLISLVLVFATYSFATESEIEPRDIIDEKSLNETENYTNSETNNMIDENFLLDDNTEGSDYYIDDDLYSIGDTEDITMDVNGNVFVLAEVANFKNVYIDGDVFVCAREVNFDGTTVNGSIFAAAQNIKFNGNAYDAYILAQDVDFLYSSSIGRNARIAADTIYLEGEIYSSAYIAGDKITIGDEAVINGNLAYTSRNEATIPSTASIGNVSFTREVENEATEEFDKMSIYMEAVSFVLKTAIISAFLLVFCNKFTKMHKEENAVKNIAKSIGNGAVSIIIIPCLIVMLMITIVGAGLGAVLLGIFIILLYFSMAIASLSIPASIFKDKVESKLGLWILSLVTAVIIWGLGKIPTIGWIISLIAVLIGVGVTIRSIFYKNKKHKETSEVEVLSKEDSVEENENPIDDEKK